MENPLAYEDPFLKIWWQLEEHYRDYPVSTQALGKNLTRYPSGTMSTHESHKENEFSTKNNCRLHYSG
jgi:hypothetical protein